MIDRKTIGTIGENAALRFLLRKGYCVLDRNWRYSRAEIDLILSKGESLIFTEVKSRYGLRSYPPETQFSDSQMNRITLAALRYMEEFTHDAEIRFDLIAVDIRDRDNVLIRHFEDVFFPGLNYEGNEGDFP